ncbi:hypothetical protein MCOR27_011359 [Pyricularia oryzae]|nr:hypothetical protein OOU_Y34scaffold00534g56 [Pyricularia oryzae Y34]KAH8842372.1 hypothetical protein MCOR01_006281 [Pyricularia oryzae]KAI6302048.1 hypothetical protein MCOR33_002507 [Pyricularia grisea]KAI6258916.1 hypothetical protein MCOR19_004759 [Pyricularia oryzae]KAI6265564.1 hypothetical protein MCOR27_011359 [Pyricularia oryzae]
MTMMPTVAAMAKAGMPSARASHAPMHADERTEHGTSQLNALATPQPWPAQDRWAELRPIITRLYREENKTLKDTMEIMEREHNFSATARMYKTRIKNWGLDKKFKAKEVLVMLQAQKEREGDNKETEFVVRGHKVDQRRMKRYLQRNKIVLDRFKEGDLPPDDTATTFKSSVSGSPEGGSPESRCSAGSTGTGRLSRGRRSSGVVVHVRTPSPEPVSSSWQCVTTEPNSPRPTLGLPGPVIDAERLLHAVRSYIGGSFAAGTWFYDAFGRIQSRKGGTADSLLLDTWTRLEVVASGMATKQDVKVFGTLNPAFESLQEIVREEAPLLISRMLRLSRKLELLQNRQLWAVLVEYIGEQTLRILGPTHVMNIIWQQFRDMDVGTDEEVLDRAFMLIVAEFDRCCPSATNFGVLEAYRDHFDTVSSPSRRRNLEAQELSLRQTLALMPAHASGTPPLQGLLLRMRITSSLVACERGEYARAENILFDTSFAEFGCLGPWAVASQHAALGHILVAKKDWVRAEQAFLAAVAQVEGATGYQNESCCERMLANLERLYTSTGRYHDATEMRDRRLRRLLQQSQQLGLSRGLPFQAEREIMPYSVVKLESLDKL